MAGVQFRGKTQVLKMFQDRDVNTWAIFQGKQFINKGEGVADLESFLTLVEPNAGTSIYMLKVFEDTEVKKVKEDTKADGSFNFVFDDSYDVYDKFAYSNHKNQLFERLQKIEDALFTDDEENKTDTQPAGIGSLVNSPVVQNAIAGALGKMIDNIFGGNDAARPQPGNQPFNTRATMGNVDTQTPNGDKRLSDALQVIKHHDPKWIEHLEKFAWIANNNKQDFQVIIMTLENYNKS